MQPWEISYISNNDVMENGNMNERKGVNISYMKSTSKSSRFVTIKASI